MKILVIVICARPAAMLCCICISKSFSWEHSTSHCYAIPATHHYLRATFASTISFLCTVYILNLNYITLFERKGGTTDFQFKAKSYGRYCGSVVSVPDFIARRGQAMIPTASCYQSHHLTVVSIIKTWFQQPSN